MTFAPPHEVYALGDSLTASGTGIYPTRLASDLGPLWTVENSGVTGDTTAQMLTRLTTAILPPLIGEYLVLLGGVNDVDADIPVATIETNLQAIYTAAHGAGMKVVAVTLTPWKGFSAWTTTRQSNADTVNAWIATTATNVDVVVNPTATLVDPANAQQLLPAYDSGDHLHLSTLGYQKLADAIYLGVPAWTPTTRTAQYGELRLANGPKAGIWGRTTSNTQDRMLIAAENGGAGWLIFGGDANFENSHGLLSWNAARNAIVPIFQLTAGNAIRIGDTGSGGNLNGMSLNIGAGSFLFTNQSVSNFLLQAGCATNACPAWKKIGASWGARTANDDNDVPVCSQFDCYGSGSPEGVMVAPVGKTYHRTDGGSGTTLYVKESGTGNTGWVAK